jgi:hypothetical protein
MAAFPRLGVGLVGRPRLRLLRSAPELFVEDLGPAAETNARLPEASPGWRPHMTFRASRPHLSPSLARWRRCRPEFDITPTRLLRSTVARPRRLWSASGPRMVAPKKVPPGARRRCHDSDADHIRVRQGPRPRWRRRRPRPGPRPIVEGDRSAAARRPRREPPRGPGWRRRRARSGKTSNPGRPGTPAGRRPPRRARGEPGRAPGRSGPQLVSPPPAPRPGSRGRCSSRLRGR